MEKENDTVTSNRGMGFAKVMLVMLFASVAYIVCSQYINANIVQYATLPPTANVTVFDDRTHKDVQYNLQMVSQLPIDTIETRSYRLPLVPAGGEILYHQNPVFLVWAMFICMMIAIAAGAAPVFVSQVAELKRYFNTDVFPILMATAGSVIIAVFLAFQNFHLKGYYIPPLIIKQFHILLKDGDILRNIVICTLFFMLPAFCLVIFIPFCTPVFKPEEEVTLAKLKTAVKDLNLLHQKLQGALQVMSVIVVFSVLTSGALGQAIRSTILIKGFDLFPKEISTVYGLFFSFFLCILYVPVYYFMKQSFLTVKDKCSEATGGSEEEIKKFYESNFNETKFQSTAFENLKIVMTILAPLLSGFIPGIMDAFK